MSDEVTRSLERSARNSGLAEWLRVAKAKARADWLDEASDIYKSLMREHPESYDVILEEAQRSGLIEYRVGSTSPTYAEATHVLRESQESGTEFQPRRKDGTKIGLTFKQAVQERTNVYNATKLIEDYRPKERGYERSKECQILLGGWFSTITGVVCRGGSPEFKVVPYCEDLVNIRRNHTESFLPANFDSFKGKVLRSDDTYPDGTKKYNIWLPREKAIINDAFLEALKGDSDLLKEFVRIVYSEAIDKTAMAFSVMEKPEQDELGVLNLNALGKLTGPIGCWDLDQSARFLHVAQKRIG